MREPDDDLSHTIDRADRALDHMPPGEPYRGEPIGGPHAAASMILEHHAAAAMETARHNAVDQLCAARLRLHEAMRFAIAAGHREACAEIEHVIDVLRELSVQLERVGAMLLDVDARTADAIAASGRTADELVTEALDKAGAR